MSAGSEQFDTRPAKLPAAVPPRRPRVMLFTDSFLHGGTERQFVRVVRHLDPEKYQLLVGCLRRRGPLLAEVESLGIPIVEFPLNSLHNLRAARLFCRLVRFLRQNRIDILHAFDFYTSVFAVPAAWVAGVPVVLASRRELADLRSAWQRRAIRLACQLATGVVVNSRAAGLSLGPMRNGGHGKVDIVRNCIDLEQLRPIAAADQVRTQLGIPTDAALIGVLANLRPEKDLPMFLCAAQRVRSVVADSRFLIIGDGPERHKLEALANHLGLSGAAFFLGDRSDVPDLLAALDVFVLCSYTESFPNAILEAMAMGRPVVATNVGGTPELVEEGKTGYLVPVGDAEAIARRIVQLLRNPPLRSEMGQAGLERVKRDFTTERVKQQLEELYDSLLGKHRGSSTVTPGQ